MLVTDSKMSSVSQTAVFGGTTMSMDWWNHELLKTFLQKIKEDLYHQDKSTSGISNKECYNPLTRKKYIYKI